MRPSRVLYKSEWRSDYYQSNPCYPSYNVRMSGVVGETFAVWLIKKTGATDDMRIPRRNTNDPRQNESTCGDALLPLRHPLHHVRTPASPGNPMSPQNTHHKLRYPPSLSNDAAHTTHQPRKHMGREGSTCRESTVAKSRSNVIGSDQGENSSRWEGHTVPPWRRSGDVVVSSHDYIESLKSKPPNLLCNFHRVRRRSLAKPTGDQS